MLKDYRQDLVSTLCDQSLDKKSVKVISRKYLLNSATPAALAIAAATHGDALILNLIITPGLSSYLLFKRAEFNKYQAEKVRLLRQLTIIHKKQEEIINNYYKKDTELLRARINKLISQYAPDRVVNLKDTELLLIHIKMLMKKYGPDHIVYLNELSTELSFNIDQLLLQDRLNHRKRLEKSKQIIINTQSVDLDQSLRVKLHQEFSISSSEEYRALNFEIPHQCTLRQAFTLCQQLQQNINKDQSDIDTIDNEIAQLLPEIEILERFYRNQVTEFLSQKHELLAVLKKDEFVRKLPFKDMQSLIDRIFVLKVDSDYKDNATGNNLIHFALEAGQHNILQLLIQKGVNSHEQNNAEIAAINMPNKEGNTLLHYHANQGDFESVCDFIAAGADCTLRNNNHLTVLDIIRNGGSLIHYLLEKINENKYYLEKYLGILLKLASSALNFSHLLIINCQKQTAFTVLLSLPDEEKDTFLDIFKKSNLRTKFTCSFQDDINWAMWQHFSKLLKSSSLHQHKVFSIRPIKFIFELITGVDDEFIMKQLKFLESLQQKLFSAAKSLSNHQLIEYLSRMLPSLDEEQQESYNRYLLRVEVLKKLKNHGPLKEEDEAYFCDGTSYLSLANRGIATLTMKQDSTPNSEQPIIFSEPLGTPEKAKRTLSEGVDLLHWFDSPKNAIKNS